MAKNKVNDNGLENNVPNSIRHWYWCKSEIDKLIKRQEQCAKDIETELSSARKCGYTEEEIKELMGDVVIPSWYLIGNSIDG